MTHDTPERTALLKILRSVSTRGESELNRFADAILAAGFTRAKVEREALVNAWLPIDTAPKDGSRILSWQPSDHDDTGRYLIVAWREDDFVHEFAWLGDDYNDFSTGWASCPRQPTRWMPLPAIIRKLPSPPHDGAHAAAPTPTSPADRKE